MRAAKAARKALESGPWKTMDAADRGKLMFKLADLVEENAEELAILESLNSGKTINDARGDVQGVLNTLRYYAGWADKIEGRTVPVRGNFLSYTLRQPVGVVGQIIPWNFPLLMLAWKWGPALACGNTIVMKLAEQTPLTGMRMAELALEAGFPEGVINVLNGMGETTGDAMVTHPGIDKIAFTGSRRHGQDHLQGARPTRSSECTFELGGKSPNVIFADADLDQAVAGAFHAIYFHGGQCCTAGSRLFVEDKIRGEFVERLAEKAKQRKDRRSARYGHRAGPAGLAGADGQDPGLRRSGPEAGGQAGHRRSSDTAEGLLRRADDLRRREGRHGHRPRRDLRAGRQRSALQGHGRNAEAGQRHQLRPGGGGVDEGHRQGPSLRPRGQSRHRLGELLPRRRHHDAVRRLQDVGTWPRERRGGDRALHRAEDRDRRSSAERDADYSRTSPATEACSCVLLTTLQLPDDVRRRWAMIVRAEQACALAEPWLLGQDSRQPPSAEIDGRPVEFEEAVARAAELLADPRGFR